MALAKGKVAALPDKACLGVVAKVGKPYLSQKGVYHVMAIELKGLQGGSNGTFFYLFRPEWFGASFDPESLLDGTDEGRKLYGSYRKFVADAAKESVLESIVNSGDPNGFDRLAEAIDALGEEPDAEAVGQLLNEHLIGKETGYIMTQRKDEGELTDQYNINRFFNPTAKAIDELVEQSQNSNRRVPLVITWEE